MVTQPAYLRDLKKFSKSRWETDEEAISAAVSLQDESDRGAIILSATNLEDMLEYQIIKRMPNLQNDDATRKRIFEQDGPISSFSRKLLMAYAFGIVDKEYFKLIDIVREIRNACAHARHHVSLETPEIQVAVKVVIADMISDLKDDAPKTLRNAFLIKCELIKIYVATGKKIKSQEDTLKLWSELQSET